MKKIKKYIALHVREVIFGAILFFAASLSFALGYTANRQFDHAPIIIEKCAGM
ncbi:MAG TPA: hypothetical protein VMA75_02770 [Candidatus Paceibacterota bacterium]|nr:hypothetical protein [Candidatus Paceibacterota bacterium]